MTESPSTLRLGVPHPPPWPARPARLALPSHQRLHLPKLRATLEAHYTENVTAVSQDGTRGWPERHRDRYRSSTKLGTTSAAQLRQSGTVMLEEFWSSVKVNTGRVPA
jgi:hypothetical protein